MKNMAKRTISALLVVVLLLGVLPIPSQTVQAATPHMKKLNVKWDLKKNKEVTIYELYEGLQGKKGFHDECYKGAEKRKVKVKLTDYKITKKGKNKRKLKFTVSFEPDWIPNETEVHRLCYSDWFWETKNFANKDYFSIVDYKTGLCLKNKKNMKKFNVTVKSGKRKYSNKKVYKDDDNCEVYFYKSQCKVTVTFPKNYKDMCIVVGGYNEVLYTYSTIYFFNGSKPFGKTSFYKKGKENSHWMRVK